LRVEMIGDNNSVHIGEGGHMFNCFLGAHGGRSIRIGTGCMFANPTDIRTTDHHPILDATGARLNPDRDVVIGDRVWLARDVTLLKGSKIGSDVVIGVGSIVTGEIPSNCVAAGIPARVVREGITWKP